MEGRGRVCLESHSYFGPKPASAAKVASNYSATSIGIEITEIILDNSFFEECIAYIIS